MFHSCRETELCPGDPGSSETSARPPAVSCLQDNSSLIHGENNEDISNFFHRIKNTKEKYRFLLCDRTQQKATNPQITFKFTFVIINFEHYSTQMLSYL